MSKQNDELKRRVYAIFQPIPVGEVRVVAARRRDASTATRVRFFLIALIWLLVFVVILASYSSHIPKISRPLYAVFAFAIVVFTIELLLRLWSCTVDPRFSSSDQRQTKMPFHNISAHQSASHCAFLCQAVLSWSRRINQCGDNSRHPQVAHVLQHIHLRHRYSKSEKETSSLRRLQST